MALILGLAILIIAFAMFMRSKMKSVGQG